MLVHLQDRDQSIVFARPAVGTATTPHNVTALRASIIKRLTMIPAVVDTIDGKAAPPADPSSHLVGEVTMTFVTSRPSSALRRRLADRRA
jgi:hypothetical protein